jgi:carbon storage regulator
MLTLTRKKNQSIIVETEHGPVQVYVREIRGNQVRLGVEAPTEVRVDREEVYLARRQDVDANAAA